MYEAMFYLDMASSFVHLPDQLVELPHIKGANETEQSAVGKWCLWLAPLRICIGIDAGLLTFKDDLEQSLERCFRRRTLLWTEVKISNTHVNSTFFPRSFLNTSFTTLVHSALVLKAISRSNLRKWHNIGIMIIK